MQEFADAHPEHKELIKQTISVYNKLSYHPKFCGICDKELTAEDNHIRSNNDFHITCKEHQKYAQHFHANLVRKQLNLPEITNRFTID